jgi:hypothetical protein
VLHAYGAAEVGAGALMGIRSAAGEIDYRQSSDDVQIHLERDGHVLLSGGGVTIATGDFACRTAAGYRLRPGPTRIARDAHHEVASWTEPQWRQRTGYIQRTPGGFVRQLRAGCPVNCRDELEHSDFVRNFGMSWLEKPCWV